MANTTVQWFPGDVKVTSNLSVDTDTFHVDSVANRVGIGKTNPEFKLDINGIVNGTDIFLNGSALADDPWSTSGSDTYYTTGNVGINTNSPTANLHVEGTLRVSNVSGDSSDLLTVKESSGFTLEGYFDAGVDYMQNIDMSVEDGSYIIGGASNYQGQTGLSWIFKRVGTTWSTQTSIRRSGYTMQGSGNAISGDGTVAAISAWQAPVTTGSVHIWRRSGSTWNYESTVSEVLDTGYLTYGTREGISLSGDGSYLMVGAFGQTFDGQPNSGVVFVYKYNGTSWSKESTIEPNSPASYSWFGRTALISQDASYVYIARLANIDVYTRSGTTWTYQDTCSQPDTTTGEYLGEGTLGINADNTLLVAGNYRWTPPSYFRGQGGVAYVWERSGSTWSVQQELNTTTVPQGTYRRYYGIGCGMNREGTTVYVSSGKGAPSAGYLYKYEYNGSTWTQTDNLVFVPGQPSTPAELFGNQIIFQNNGDRLAINTKDANSPYYRNISTFSLAQTYLTVSTPIKADGTVLSFTGQHRCFPDGPLSQGQIVSANKNKYISLNGPLTTGSQAIKSSESLPMVSLSNVVNDTTVFGVVDHIENNESVRSQKNGIGIVTQDKELGDNRVVVNSLGEGAIWVVNTNGNLASGDYITTSNVTGYGQKQDDSDTLYSYTVAKITMDCDFNPQDVPIQVIKKDENGQNILDSYGRLQWEDHPTDVRKAYKIRHLTVDGEDTDEANSAWIAAYVGCTYHCG